MKTSLVFLSFLLSVIFWSCSNNKSSSKGTSAENDPPKNENTSSSNIGVGIVGEWKQRYACHDKNGDAILDQAERDAATQTLGFDYFKFSSDGTCLRDEDIKMKGKYEVKETGSKKELVIYTPDGSATGIKYTIKGDITDELILFNSGVFLVFNRK